MRKEKTRREQNEWLKKQAEKKKEDKKERSKSRNATYKKERDFESEQQMRQLSEQFCLKADRIFFGLIDDNVQKAIELYENSASLESSKAMLALGRIYENGIGTDQDISLAFDYYDDAAGQNEPYAFYNLGQFFERGHGKDSN